MANPDTPNGLRPVRYLDGSPYNGAHNLYYVPASYGTAIFIGDIVTHAGDAGPAGTFVSGVDVEGMPVVNLYAVGDNMMGVVVGFLPNPTALQTNHKPATTAAILMVADDPGLIFEVQEDSVGANFAAVDVGRNVDVVTALAGNTTTGTSAIELDSSVTSVTTTAGFRLMRLVPRPGNAIGANARWEVKPVEHMSLSATGI